MQEQSMVGKPSNLDCAQINTPVASVVTPIPVKSWTARRDAGGGDTGEDQDCQFIFIQRKL